MVDIKEWRQEFGITQQALAKASGLDVRWIQKVEAGDIDIMNVTVKRFTLLMKGISSLSEQSNNPCKMQNQVKTMIIPGISEPPARTLRATVPENERHIFR